MMLMLMVMVVIMVGTVGWRVMATAAVANGLLCAETVISPALAPMLPGPPAVPRGQSGQHERPRPLTPRLHGALFHARGDAAEGSPV